MAVPSAQRFRAGHPCPICGGHNQMARDQGRRCYGYLSGDGLYAHCTREEMATGLDREAGDTYAHRLAGDCRCGQQHGAALPLPSSSGAIPAKRGIPPAKQVVSPQTHTVAATYDYHDVAGVLRYQVVRYAPKAFRQRRPDGNGDWIWNLEGVTPLLYRLPELVDARRDVEVWIVEGERDADTMLSWCLLATCNSGGAGKWPPEMSTHLAGRPAIIVADKDEAGRKHASQVAHALRSVAASVKVVELPDVGGGQPVKDFADYAEAGGTIEALYALMDAAPEWRPGPLLDGLREG